MTTFYITATLHNLTPPETPITVRGFTVERHPYPPSVTDEMIERITPPDWNLIQRTELSAAISLLHSMASECILRYAVQAPDVDTVMATEGRRIAQFVQAIELLTGKAVELGHIMFAPEVGGIAFFYGQTRAFRGGPASIGPQMVTVLDEVLQVLQANVPKRIETALLEYDTALKSEDIRRQFIHSVVALEALFGDSASEALSYKVPLRAALLIPSLATRKKEGFRRLRQAYNTRNAFVHGTWDQRVLTEAETIVDEVVSLTGEAVFEFLQRVKDGKQHEFPALDEEVFFS